MEAGGGAFERARSGGINDRGASMSVRHGCAEGKLHNCCCINIYVNSNIQGVSNSILKNGSEVKMGSPGVWFFFDQNPHQNPNQWQWLWLLVGAVLLLILIVVVLLATPKLGMFHS